MFFIKTWISFMSLTLGDMQTKSRDKTKRKAKVKCVRHCLAYLSHFSCMGDQTCFQHWKSKRRWERGWSANHTTLGFDIFQLCFWFCLESRFESKFEIWKRGEEWPADHPMVDPSHHHPPLSLTLKGHARVLLSSILKLSWFSCSKLSSLSLSKFMWKLFSSLVFS